MRSPVGLDKVMRSLRIALEASHPKAVEEFVASLDEYAMTSLASETIKQSSFRKMEAIAREVQRMNSAQQSVANTKPAHTRVRVFPSIHKAKKGTPE